MPQLDITAHGFDQAAAKIQDIGDRGRHAKPAMREIITVIERGEQALWKRRGGAKWAPHPDGTPAGVLSGDLEASLTQSDAPGAIRIIADDHMLFGTSLWYSRFMQAGTTVKGKRHAPKRPIIVYRPVDRKRTREILAKWLKGDLTP